MSFVKSEKNRKSSKHSELGSTILALDIGTEFVKCVFGKLDRYEEKKKDQEPGRLKILGFSKVRQGVGNMSNGGISNIKGVIKTCEEAISVLEEESGWQAKTVVVGISGELVKGSTTTIRYRRDSSTKAITDSELKELLSKIEAKAEKKIRDEVALETDNPDVQLSLINSAVVSIAIDGYRVNNPVGFRGTEVLIEYYTAFAPKVYVSAIEKVCSELELDLLAVVVEPFAVSRACLGDEIDLDFSGILIDVGGGTTDIAVVDAGEICGTKMLNIAGQSFTKQIANELNIRPATAEKYKVNLEDENLLSDSIINKTTGAARAALSVWLTGISIGLEEFKNVSPLPSDIYLSGGSANLLPLQEALATSDWFSGLDFEKRPIIHILDPLSLPDFSFSEDEEEIAEMDCSFITSLGLLRVAVDTLITTPEKHSLKERISKLLSH